MPAKLLKKLTVKEIGAKPDLRAMIAANDKGERYPVARVVGIARKTKPYIDPKDGKESILFFGSFKGTNLQTGAEFMSGKAFFPGAIPDMLYGALGGETTEVQFGFDIYAEFNETAATKYVYQVESLIPLAENDSLRLLSDSISAPLPALPAPAQGTLPAPEAAPAPEAPKSGKRK